MMFGKFIILPRETHVFIPPIRSHTLDGKSTPSISEQIQPHATTTLRDYITYLSMGHKRAKLKPTDIAYHVNNFFLEQSIIHMDEVTTWVNENCTDYVILQPASDQDTYFYFFEGREKGVELYSWLQTMYRRYHVSVVVPEHGVYAEMQEWLDENEIPTKIDLSNRYRSCHLKIENEEDATAFRVRFGEYLQAM
jgi:hypothetical protein